MGKKYARKNEVGEERRAEIRKLLLKAAADSSLRLTGEQEILNAVGAQSREYGAVFEELDQSDRRRKNREKQERTISASGGL